MASKNRGSNEVKDIPDSEYYGNQPDYDEIAEYLDTTPIDEELINGKLPAFQPDYSNAIVVDNIPVVAEERVPKLYNVLHKIYSQINLAFNATEDIFLPVNSSTKMTEGFCFIKFPTAELAKEAIRITNGFALDKNHTFVVNSYSDLEIYNKLSADDKLEKLPEFYSRPEIESWLSDVKGRDQFVMRHGYDTEIFWSNTTGEEPEMIYGGEREKQSGKIWCEMQVEWSPQGTYLATFHKQGVKLWGGHQFQPCGRFVQAGVEEISFSPCENYIVTYRITGQTEQDQESIIVWDVRTGLKLRCFSIKNPLSVNFYVDAMVQEEKNSKKVDRIVRGKVKACDEKGYFTIEEGNNIFEGVSAKDVRPVQNPNKLRWSQDGKYVSRIGSDLIYVYELPGMTLLEKKSLSTKDIIDYSWSPRANLISYLSPAVGNLPAIVNIVKVPERDNICSRKFFDVTDGKMVWQSEGEFLCVHLVKTQGKKKTSLVVFFRVKSTGNIPVEQIELNEPILNVAWEPAGGRVAIMYGDARSPSIAFYSMTTQVVSAPAKAVPGAAKSNTTPTITIRPEINHLFTKTGVQCNDLQWSPAGGVIALAYFASDACLFELFDVENNVTLATKRHDRGSKLSWDPSGRFLASITITELRNANVRGNHEDGLNVYSFQGNSVVQFKREKVFGFSWRPRPRDLLSADEKKKVARNIKKYEKQFDQEDRQKRQELTQELQAARFRAAEEFLAWMNRNRAVSAALKPRRISLRDGYDSDDDRNYEIEVIN